MHIIEVECICKVCGEPFTVKQSCRDMLEVEIQSRKILNRRKPVCSTCYFAEKKAQAEEKVSKMGLPELIGRSEKQIEYALSLRTRYITSHEVQINRVQNELARINEELLKKAAKIRKTDEEGYLEEALDRVGLKKAYLCLTEVNAQRLIDNLKE